MLFRRKFALLASGMLLVTSLPVVAGNPCDAYRNNAGQFNNCIQNLQRQQQEAQMRAQQEAQMRAQRAAQIRAQQEAQMRAQQEAQIRAQRVAQMRAQQETQMRAQQEAQIRVQRQEQLNRQKQTAKNPPGSFPYGSNVSCPQVSIGNGMAVCQGEQTSSRNQAQASSSSIDRQAREADALIRKQAQQADAQMKAQLKQADATSKQQLKAQDQQAIARISHQARQADSQIKEQAQRADAQTRQQSQRSNAPNTGNQGNTAGQVKYSNYGTSAPVQYSTSTTSSPTKSSTYGTAAPVQYSNSTASNSTKSSSNGKSVSAQGGSKQSNKGTPTGTQPATQQQWSTNQPTIAKQQAPGCQNLQAGEIKKLCQFATKDGDYPLGAPIPCSPTMSNAECKQVNVSNGLKWDDKNNRPISPTLGDSVKNSYGNVKRLGGECRKAAQVCLEIAGGMIAATEFSVAQKAALKTATYNKNLGILIFKKENDKLLFKGALLIFES